jgi:hypothetical protein
MSKATGKRSASKAKATNKKARVKAAKPQEQRLANFDRELARIGIVDTYPPFIVTKRNQILKGKFGDDDEVQRFLDTPEVRDEAFTRKMLDSTLGQLGHGDLRAQVLGSWHAANRSMAAQRRTGAPSFLAVAYDSIAIHRAGEFLQNL